MLKLHEMSSPAGASQARPNNRLQRTAFDVVACAARACGDIMHARAAQDMLRAAAEPSVRPNSPPSQRS